MPLSSPIVPEKAMVFIDAMNLYESLGRLNIETDVDYHKFARKLTGADRRLIRCYVYTGAYDQKREPERYASQMKFFNTVRRMRFVELKTRPLILRKGDWFQKGVDTLLATDMVTMAFMGNYDVAILVSGDGDLAPAIDAVKAAGKQVIVATFPRSRSTAVSQSADLEIHLNKEFFADCY